MEIKKSELRNLLRLLRAIGSCDSLNHRDFGHHSASEPCPVLIEASKQIDRIFELLRGDK